MSQVDSFEQAIALERISENEHRVIFPDGWQQGRGAFGGVVLGALQSAMGELETDATRLPRTFSGDLCGPAMPREARIITRLLRRGKSQTNLAATLEQDGALIAHATCMLAAPRRIATPPALAFAPPPRAAYETAQAVTLEPIGPPFARYYEYRPTGPLPFMAGDEALVLGWIKERVPLSRVTAAAILARLDAHWPAFFSCESLPRPAATVTYLAEFLCDPSTLDPHTPLFYRGRAVAQAGGYVVELRELWNDDTLVAMNQQTFALLA